MAGENNPLKAFSDSLVKAIETGGASTVLVDARHRFPASGVAYTAELILTADHVVEREDDISVVLPDGRRIPASIAGRDPGSDIALLRLGSSDATPARRTEGEAQVGEFVIALGRPSQGGIEASVGIVSSSGGPVRTGRGGLLDRFLVTDTTPFPGFSGGPLIDSLGRVVGLNTSGLMHGAAITIPSSLAWVDAENLAKHGYIKRGYLGIRSQTVALSSEMQSALGRTQESGLLLVSVEPDSPSSSGGLMVGDILVTLDGKPIAGHDELMILLTGIDVGSTAAVEVLRGGKPHTVNVTVGERK